MKTILVLSLVVATLIQCHAQGFGQTTTMTPAATAAQPSAGSGFAAGLLSEEGEDDLAAAAATYRKTIQAFDRQRDQAANAIFRLGEVYRKLGRMEEAKVQYARILREFPDMVRLTEISHNLLFGDEAQYIGSGGGGLGAGGGSIGAGGMPRAGAATTNVSEVRAEERAQYIDAAMSRPADPRDPERIMMQRYGITGSGAVRESSAPEAANRITCMNNLKQLGLAARIYATDHNGAFPREVGLMSNEIHVSKVLVCPSDTSHEPATSWDEFRAPLHMTYEYGGVLAWVDQPQTVLFRCPIHGHVTLGDGSVQQGQGQSQQSAVTPQGNEILRQRYGLGGAGRSAAKPSADASPWDSIERVPKVLDGEIKLFATLMIAFLRDGGLTLNGGPMDLAAVTQLISQVPDEMRALTSIELQAEPETDFSRIVEVLDACQEAGISRVTLGTEPKAVIGQEIERLEGDYRSLRTELSSIQQEAGALTGSFVQFNRAIDQARSRQILAKERLEALSFPADRLPAVVGQDARYQRLKAEYETAVLDGDKAAEERARARLQEWVEVIYRPELESEAELAERRLEETIAEEQEHRKQQSLQAQQREMQRKLTTSQERINQLNTLLNRTQ